MALEIVLSVLAVMLVGIPLGIAIERQTTGVTIRRLEREKAEQATEIVRLSKGADRDGRQWTSVGMLAKAVHLKWEKSRSQRRAAE